MNGINAMTMNKIAWRRKSFLVLCYCLAFPDRANAGFAALQGRSNAAFDLGAACFF
jgi:MFS transporter, ACS family, tartrate transporter